MPQAKTLTIAGIQVVPVSQDKNGVWTFREAVASTKSISLAKVITSSCIRKPKSGKYVVTHKITSPRQVETNSTNRKAIAYNRMTVIEEYDERIPLQDIRTDTTFFRGYQSDESVAKMSKDLENFQ